MKFHWKLHVTRAGTSARIRVFRKKWRLKTMGKKLLQLVKASFGWMLRCARVQRRETSNFAYFTKITPVGVKKDTRSYSLRKIFRRKQKFCSIQMCSICYSCCWRPRRLNRKTWRPSRGSLHRVLVWVCAYSYFRWRPWRPFSILNIIDKRKNKKEHFCSSGSSGIHEDTQHQT